MGMQKSRSNKRYNASGGGSNNIPLTPIYENDHIDIDIDIDALVCNSDDDDSFDFDPLREYMSRTILKHTHACNNQHETNDMGSSINVNPSSPDDAPQLESSSSSGFQIVSDNAQPQAYPEFIVTKHTHTHSKVRKTKSSGQGIMMRDNRWEDSKPQKQKQQRSSKSKSKSKSKSSKASFSAERRWGSGGDSPTSTKKRSVNFGNGSDSSTSINTSSTSSLSFWDSFHNDDCDCDCDCDDHSVESFTAENHKYDMSSKEIIQRASDVIAGKYDTKTTSTSACGHGHGQGRRQARRSSMPSSMPSMPIRSTTSLSFGLAPLKPLQKTFRSSSLDGPPPSSFYDSLPMESCSVSDPPLDKFGIPTKKSSNHRNRRRRSIRRSSVQPPPKSDSEFCAGHVPPVQEEDASSIPVDKYGIPISQTTSISSSSSSSTSLRYNNRRRERRASDNTYERSNTTSRRRERRSSMPSRNTSSDDTNEPSFGIPIRPAPLLSSASASASAHEPTSRSNTTGRRRHGRRSSMPSAPTTGSAAFDVDVDPSCSSSHSRSSHSCSSSGSSSSSGSAPVVDKFGIPIRQHQQQHQEQHRRQERRSSLPTRATESADEPSVPVDKFGMSYKNIPNRAVRRGRRPSMPTVSTYHSDSEESPPEQTSSTSASAIRFLPEELRIPSRNEKKNHHHQSANPQESSPPRSCSTGAPIRPDRVPSVDSFGGSQHEKRSIVVTHLGQQQNASFEVKEQPLFIQEAAPSSRSSHERKTANTTKTPESSVPDNNNNNSNHNPTAPPIAPQRVPSVDTVNNNGGGLGKNNPNLGKIVGRPNSRWGVAGATGGKLGESSSSVLTDASSTNSMKQKEGEWWW